MPEKLFSLAEAPAFPSEADESIIRLTPALTAL